MDDESAGRLGAADTAWWRMDEPTNPMVITAVLAFSAPVAPERLERRVRETLLPLAPFRCRVADGPLGVGRARWAPAPGFSLARHLKRVRLPGAAGDPELRALVSRLMSEPLDHRYPLWAFHLVENYGGGAALVARVHHCIADGMALIQLLLALDDVPGNEGPAHVGWNGPVAAAPAGATPATISASRSALRRATLAGKAAAAVARMVLLLPDRRGPLAGPLGARKAAAWSEAFPLPRLRAAARGAGCTLNDLLAAAAAGALRRYVAGRGLAARPASLRAVVPVNLRPRDDASVLGNRFGLVFLRLPAGVAEPAARLARVHAEMCRLKASAEAGATFLMLRLFGPAGRAAVRLAVWFLGMKATVVFTDVPGPREPVTFCGAPLVRLMAWVPQAGRLSVGVSVVSYAGSVQVGVCADHAIVPDPGALVDAYRDALAELVGGDSPGAGELAAVQPGREGAGDGLPAAIRESAATA